MTIDCYYPIIFCRITVRVQGTSLEGHCCNALRCLDQRSVADSDHPIPLAVFSEAAEGACLAAGRGTSIVAGEDSDMSHLYCFIRRNAIVSFSMKPVAINCICVRFPVPLSANVCRPVFTVIQ